MHLASTTVGLRCESPRVVSTATGCTNKIALMSVNQDHSDQRERQGGDRFRHTGDGTSYRLETGRSRNERGFISRTNELDGDWVDVVHDNTDLDTCGR